MCRLFDDEDKKQFHCDQCGICRLVLMYFINEQHKQEGFRYLLDSFAELVAETTSSTVQNVTSVCQRNSEINTRYGLDQFITKEL